MLGLDPGRRLLLQKEKNSEAEKAVGSAHGNKPPLCDVQDIIQDSLHQYWMYSCSSRCPEFKEKPIEKAQNDREHP